MMDGGKSKRLAKRQQHLGDEFKNTAEYRAMRRKNNEAAKKCRENRRIKEVDTDQKVKDLNNERGILLTLLYLERERKEDLKFIYEASTTTSTNNTPRPS